MCVIGSFFMSFFNFPQKFLLEVIYDLEISTGYFCKGKYAKEMSELPCSLQL
jgi:hypothetical protein